MSIILLGGHERMKEEYRGIGVKYGHKIKVFTEMPARFDKSIGSPDVMIILTSTVSHKMVLTAVKEAKKKSIQIVRNHSSSASALEETFKTWN